MRGFTVIAGWLAVASTLPGCGESIWDVSRFGKIDEVRAILDRDPQAVHARNKRWEKTPLFFSVSFGKPDVTKLLIEKGADVKAADVTGLQPLHAAAWMNQPEQADILLAHGADLEAKDDFGDTPLHVAAHRQQPAMYVYLLKKGANPDATNHAGLTPLQLAQKSLSPESYDRLIANIERIRAEQGV